MIEDPGPRSSTQDRDRRPAVRGHQHCFDKMQHAMRSPIRALLVALVATLGLVLVAPSIAEAKPKHTHATKVTRKTVKSTKRVVKHPWSKGHAKAHAKPQRLRKSPEAKHHPRKG